MRNDNSWHASTCTCQQCLEWCNAQDELSVNRNRIKNNENGKKD